MILNITASFLTRFIMTLLLERTDGSPNWRRLIPREFSGGYNTFSSFEYETFRVSQDGEPFVAGTNTVFSAATSFFAVWLGMITGRTNA